MDSAPRCQDDAILTPAGEHAVVSQLQSMAYERMIPLNVSLELTLKCNIRCLHCYNFDRDTAGPARAVAGGDLPGDGRAARGGDALLVVDGRRGAELAPPLPGAGPRARAEPGGPDA